MKSITDIFIRKPVLAVVINLVIILIGLRAVFTLPVQQYPKIESSSLVITTVYIGAPADNIRASITTPIEKAVSAVGGVDYVESASIAGVSTVTVRLKLNYAATAALAEVSARLQQVRSELPSEAEPPAVEIQRADRPWASFYVSYTTDQLSRTQLTEYLERVIRPELSTIPGIQRAGVEGGRPLAMRIWLDPQKMTGLGITAEQINTALQRNNFLSAVGQAKGASVQIDLLANTDLRNEEEFRQLVVAERDGAIVRLGELARVELGSEEATGGASMNGKDAVFISVWPLPGSNEISVAAALRDKLAEIKPSLPVGVDQRLAYDATKFMSNSIKEISKTLGETVLIVGLVVFLFMGSIRTALVPLIAMPVSLIGAAALMAGLGFSLNLLTLLAIVLAVGLVVDDAIVVVENVERHVREGKSRPQAALIGARELAGPVITMTITLAAVYAPIGIQGGLTGVLFKEFAFTLAAAVVVSGIVALTLSPIMSARLVHEGGKEGAFTRWVNRRFETVRRSYAALLDRVLQLRPAVVAGSVLVILAGVPLYMFSAKELAPTEDQGGMFVILTSPPEATLEYKVQQGEKIAAALQGFNESDYVWQVIFGGGAFGGVELKPWQDRDRTTHEMIGEAFGRVGAIPGVQAFPILPPSLPGAGNYDVELLITSPDEPKDMEPVATAMVTAAFNSGMFMFADTDLKIDMPQARVVIDRTKVADLGLDLATVGQQLATLLAGGYVNRFNFEGRSYKVIPQVELRDRATAERLLDLKLAIPTGQLISVSSFASIASEVAPRALNRFQQRNSVKIFGGVVPGVTKEQALTALEKEAKKILPPGYAVDFAGESRQIRQEGSQLVGTLGFALALIYLVLAAQFASFRDPLIVLAGSVPLALSGALVFTFLGLTTINIYTQVGLITLVGLVAKNGILMVEWANHLREHGKNKLEAIHEACLTRLRPILMTSAATVFGHLPLVFVSGPGAEARNSIGIVLVTGMSIGTIFTLFVVPVLYVLIASKHEAPVDITADMPTTGSSTPGSNGNGSELNAHANGQTNGVTTPRELQPATQ